MNKLSTETRRDYILILIASLCFHIYCMMVNAVIAGYSEYLGAQATVMGLIGGLMSLCSLLCRPIMGNLVNLIAKKSFVLSGFALVLVGGIIISIAPSYRWIIVARIINGIGFAGCSIGLTTWISDILPQSRVGSGIAMYGTVNAVAMSVGPSLGIELYKSFGYRSTFVVSAAVATIGFISILIVENAGDAKRDKDYELELRLFEPKVLVIAITMVLFAIPYSATQSFLVRYIETRQINVSASLYFLVYAIAVLVMRTAFRKNFDIVKLKTSILLCSASALAALVTLCVVQNNLSLSVAACFMAGGYGLFFTIAQASAITSVNPDKKGIANGTFYMGFDIGMWLGPTIAGLIYGYCDIKYFYPLFVITVPIIIIVYTIGVLKKISIFQG